MARFHLTLTSDSARGKAIEFIGRAPHGSRVEFKGPRRSTDQNSLMWGLLSDLAEQLRWHGLRLSADDWKIVMLDGLKRELRMVPNINGDGFVQLGRSSSDLTKDEMTALIELIYAFGAQHGVVFSYGENAG